MRRINFILKIIHCLTKALFKQKLFLWRNCKRWYKLKKLFLAFNRWKISLKCLCCVKIKFCLIALTTKIWCNNCVKLINFTYLYTHYWFISHLSKFVTFYLNNFFCVNHIYIYCFLFAHVHSWNSLSLARNVALKN